jgi:hypothetical protein
MRNPTGYTPAMITSFAHKGLEDFFYEGASAVFSRGMRRGSQTSLIDSTRPSTWKICATPAQASTPCTGRSPAIGPSESLGTGV